MKNVIIRRKGRTPVGNDPDKPANMHQLGNGTFQVKFFPVRSSFFRSEGDKEGLVDAQIQCITAIDYYKNYSLEELRWDDYNIRAFRAVPSTATKELQSKSVQNHPVVNLSGPCQSSSDKEVPTQNETSMKERRDSWPSLDRTLPPSGRTSPIPIRRSLPPTGSNHKLSPVRWVGSSSPSDALTLNTSVDVNGLLRASSPQTSHDALNSTNGPIQSSVAEPATTPSSDGLAMALGNGIIQPTVGDRPTSDPSQNGLIHNSGAASNSPLGLTPSSPIDRPIRNITEATTCHSARGKLPNTEVVLQPNRPAHSPSKTGLAQCPKPLNRNLELGTSQNDLHQSNQHPGAHPGMKTTAPKKDHSDDCSGSRSFIVGAEREAVSQALGQGVGRLTDLQRSICDLLCQGATGETLSWHIVFELRSSQDFTFYEQMPGDVLCLAVENRELLTKQLMDLFHQSAKRNVQICHVVLETLSNEFRFIGRLKLLMMKKLLEVRNSDSTESKHCNIEPSSSTRKMPISDCINSGARLKSAAKFSTEQEEQESDMEIRDRSSDVRVRAFLNDKDDVLVFSEPGTLFRFAVQPGSQYVEKWTEKGNGMVSVYENAEMKQAKIVVCHWTAKRSHSVIIVKPSMKARFSFSEDGMAVKFMGLDAYEGQKSMRYFKVQFKESDGATAFSNVFQCLPFLNTSKEVPGLVCCLDFKFKSQRIHDEFPAVKSDKTSGDATTFLDDLRLDEISKTHCSSMLRVHGDIGKLDCGEIDVCRGDDLSCSRNEDDLVVTTLKDFSRAVGEMRRSSLSPVETRNSEDAFSGKPTNLTPGVENQISPQLRKERNDVTADDGCIGHCCDIADQPHSVTARSRGLVCKENAFACNHDSVICGCHDNQDISHHGNIARDLRSEACNHDNVIGGCHDNQDVSHRGNRAMHDSGREEGESDDEVARHKDHMSTNHHDNIVKYHHGKGIEGHHGDGFVSPCDDDRISNYHYYGDEHENESTGIEAIVMKGGERKTEVADVKEKHGHVGGKKIEDCTNDEDEANGKGRCEEIKGVIESDVEIWCEEIGGVIKAAEEMCEEIKGVIETDIDEKCEEIKGVIEVDVEEKYEEIKGVIEVDVEEKCEEIKGVIETDVEEKCEEIKGVIKEEIEGLTEEAAIEEKCEDIKGMIEGHVEEKCEEIKGVIEVDAEERCEEFKGVIETDINEKCEEIRGVIKTALEEKCEKIKDVIEADVEERCVEIKGVIETDIEEKCEEIKGVIKADVEEKCEEIKGVNETDIDKKCEEIKGVIKADVEEKCEEIKGVIEVDVEERCEEIKGVIEADVEERCEEIKVVIEVDVEEKHEEIKGVIEAEIEEKCEEIKGVIEAGVKERCEEIGVIETDIEGRCEEIKGVIASDMEGRCEENRGVIETDMEEIKGVVEADIEGRCEDIKDVLEEGDIEGRCEEIKGVIEAGVEGRCEENKVVCKSDGEDRCEERPRILLTTEEEVETPEFTFLDLIESEETQSVPTEGNCFSKDCQSEVDNTFGKNSLEGFCSWSIQLLPEVIESFDFDENILATENVKKSATKRSVEMVKDSELQPSNNLQIRNEIVTCEVSTQIDKDGQFKESRPDNNDRILENIEQDDTCGKFEDFKQDDICRNFKDLKEGDIGGNCGDIKQDEIDGTVGGIEQCGRDGKAEDFFKTGIRRRVTMT